jgi:hypothetical protein
LRPADEVFFAEYAFGEPAEGERGTDFLLALPFGGELDDLAFPRRQATGRPFARA